jgi:hypothetical protein
MAAPGLTPPLLVGWTLLGMWTGCKPLAPLSEVPLLGGSQEQRALVSEQLAAFEGWSGPERVQLRSIRFVEQEGSHLGRYHLRQKRIELAPHLTGDTLAVTLRHELCHALERQEDLVSTLPQFQNLAEDLELEGIDLIRDGKLDSGVLEQSEVMALLCEEGPASTLLAQLSCPTDSPGLEVVGRWFAEQVWLGEPDLGLGAALTAEPLDARHTSPFVPHDIQFFVEPSGQSALLAMHRREEEELQSDELWIDLHTGEPVEAQTYEDSGAYDLDPVVPLPVGLTAPPTSRSLVPIHTVVQGERAAVIVDGPDFHLWQLAPRLIFLDEGQWWAVEHCPGAVGTVFPTPEALWVAWAEQHDIRWAPISQ